MTQMQETKKYTLSVDQIQKFIPHRAPFLLVDRILDIQPHGDTSVFEPSNLVGTRVEGLKNLSFNEPFFQGHFPGFAIFPGVLMIEAMAQTSCFSLYPYVANRLEQFTRDFQCILVGVDGARFRKPTVPGDSVHIHAELTKARGRLLAFHCEAKVDGQKVAEANLMANMISSEMGAS